MRHNPAADIESEIARLRGLNLDELHLAWRAAFGRRAPDPLPKHLLMRILMYRLQVLTFGDLSRSTAQLLASLATDKDGGSRGAIATPGKGSLKPGTVLIREHGGERHHVMVVDDGFSWNGKTYPSLTKVAHAITGTNWNGPRFFGMRDKPSEKRT